MFAIDTTGNRLAADFDSFDYQKSRRKKDEKLETGLTNSVIGGLSSLCLVAAGMVLETAAQIIAQREVVARMNLWFGPLLQNYQR